jgi:hypothetical protein
MSIVDVELTMVVIVRLFRALINMALSTVLVVVVSLVSELA